MNEWNPEVQNLQVNINSMKFPEDKSFLIENLNFTLKPGEIVTLMGPSGIGKTTFLRIIAGLETRFNGEILIRGKVNEAPSRVIQLLYQDYCLFPWMTARENVMFSLAHSHSDDEKNAADSLLYDVGLENKSERWPCELSGGEIARVALARAICGHPAILLLDEPFSNIDLQVKRELQLMVVNLAKEHNVGIVMVTHDIKDAVFLSDRIFLAREKPMGNLIEIEIDHSFPRQLQSKFFQDIIFSIEKELLSLEINKLCRKK